MSDLAKLATPIPDTYIEKRQNQSYVAHEVVTQWLLYVVGPFDFELVQVHRGDVLSRNRDQGTPPFSDAHSEVVLRGVIVGATYRLSCSIDGRRTVIEHTGDVDQPTNWQHDGARLKDAESDAIKRCARQVGVALHLWAGGEYFLDKWLAKREREREREGQPETSEGRGERASGRAGRPAATCVNGSSEPATTRAPSDETPAGVVEGEDRPLPAPAGHTPGPHTQAPAGARDGAPAGPVDPEQSPDELLASLGTDATAAEKAFAAEGFTIKQASDLFLDRYGTNMEGQYAERSLRKLRGRVIGEYVADAVKLRAAKLAALRTQAQAEVAEATT